MPPVFTSSVLAPHERGVELGTRFATEIADTVGRYRRLFETVAVGAFDVDLWSARAWHTITELAPQHAEEIAGIAAGAGLSVEQVASVNARTELLVAANPACETECSTVVSLPPGRPPVAVQTWDWYDAMSAGWFTWTIPFPDGRVVRTVTEFGMLAKIGVNDRGVGVLLNMLHHAEDERAVADGRIGHPVHLLSRAILDEASDTADAVRIASEARTTASTSLTVVDAAGASVSVELFPGGPGLLEPEDGVLVRTNHFVSETGRAGCLASRLGVSTELRRDHLLRAFAEHRPQTAAEVVDAMHHHLADGGVCRHPLVATDPALWHRTLATVTLDVAGRTLAARPDGPCGQRLQADRAKPSASSSSGEVAWSQTHAVTFLA
jgi:isopenicillin-N N-acyltransferase-like protein